MNIDHCFCIYYLRSCLCALVIITTTCVIDYVKLCISYLDVMKNLMIRAVGEGAALATVASATVADALATLAIASSSVSSDNISSSSEMIIDKGSVDFPIFFLYFETRCENPIAIPVSLPVFFFFPSSLVICSLSHSMDSLDIS